MKNITLALDEQTAAWARVQAAEQNMSLSRYVGEILQDRMRHSRAYAKAMRESLAEKPLALTGTWEPYPTREEIHDRSMLRRR